jgi:hypothetical protein
MALPQSLPGLLYLLGCSIEKNRPPGGIAAPHLLRAAALEELRLAGVIGDRREDANPKSDVFVLGPLGDADPVLAALLGEIEASRRRRSWVWWVGHGEKHTAEAVFEQLAEAGAIEVDRHRVLGIIPHTDVTVADPAAVEQLRTRLRGLLRGGPAVADLDPRAVALLALAGAAELRSVLDRGERREFRDRLAEIDAAAGPLPAALRKVVRDKKSANAGGVTAATSGAVIGGC